MRYFKLLLISILIGPSLFAQSDSTNNAKPGDDPGSYATLYVYRPDAIGGSFVSYDLYLNDSLLCRVKNNTKFILKLYKEGPFKIWAKSGLKYEAELFVKFGESYYLLCGVNAGLPHSTPYFTIRDEGIGQKEFKTVKGRKNKKDDNNETPTSNH
jgi:hypothetical protein